MNGTSFRPDLTLTRPPLLRRAPDYVGPVAGALDTLANDRIIKIGLVTKKPPHRLAIDDVTASVSGPVLAASLFSGSEYHQGWCLLADTPENFEAAGVLMLPADRTHPPEPALVSTLSFAYRRARGGNQPRGAAMTEAREVLGSHLYWLERHLVGAFGTKMDRRSAAIAAQSMIEERLAPIRKIMRASSGAVQDMSRLLEDIRRQGAHRIRQINALPHWRGPLPIAAGLQAAGAAIASQWQGPLEDEPFFAEGFAVLSLCIALCRRAARIEREGILRLRPVGPSIGTGFRVNAAMAAAMTGGPPEASLAFDRFDVLSLLARSYDFDPLPYYPELAHAHHHFALARALGRLHRLGVVDIGQAAYWGLRGLERSIFDGLLPEPVARARADLRRSVPDEVWDWLARQTAPPPVERRDGGERVRSWHHVKMRRPRSSPR